MYKSFLAAAAACLSFFLPLSALAARLTSPAPQALTQSTSDEPLSLSPVLSWTKDINAVSYELELSADLSYRFSDRKPCKNALFSSKFVYHNNYNLPISIFLQLKEGEVRPLVWRVRSLNQKRKPISPFSQPAIIFVSGSVPGLNAPIPLHPGAPDDEVQLLYPVYSWIMPYGSETFEVEVYDRKPVKGIAPIWKGTSNYSELYDEYPRAGSEPFYWRVRAFSIDKKQIGNWSDFASFSFPKQKAEIAVFGDSISHGGGHLSFGPNHRELSWLNYLNVPVLNLAQSGNTTKKMVERFDNDVLPFAPKYLLIMGGTNDYRGEIPADETIRNLAVLKEKCLKNNIRPIFLTLPPVNPKNTKKIFNEQPPDKTWKTKRQKCNDFIRTMPYFIDTAAYFEPFCKKGILPTEYALDGLHPDANGKALIAKSVNENLERVTK